jgi:hypothetical protein
MAKPATDLRDSQVTLAPALEKRTRRRFSTEYKLRMITEAETCKRDELGALLRRENLYSNPLQQRRRESTEQCVRPEPVIAGPEPGEYARTASDRGTGKV